MRAIDRGQQRATDSGAQGRAVCLSVHLEGGKEQPHSAYTGQGSELGGLGFCPYGVGVPPRWGDGIHGGCVCLLLEGYKHKQIYTFGGFFLAPA